MQLDDDKNATRLRLLGRKLLRFPKLRLETFASLKNRDFRWYWLGLLASYNGMNMQTVARGWLVYSMTDSPLALGIVTAGFGLPLLLFSLHAGAIVDRFRKRNILLATRTGMGLVSFVVTILIVTDLIAVWHLVAASVLSGVFLAFYLPARQAFISDLVEPEALLNAVAMNSMAMNITRVASPALAGVLLKMIGIPGVYWIVSISAALVIVTLIMITPGEAVPSRKDRPLLTDVKEGVLYVFDNRIILVLMLLAFIPFMTAMSFQMLMPVFAKSVFHAGETGLGLLMSAIGLGALTGSAMLASAGDVQRKGMLTLLTGFTFGFFLIAFGATGSLYPAFFFLFLVGGGSSAYMTLNMTLVMSNTPEKMVGRVMSIYMMTFGLMPLGTLPAGAIAEAIGAQATVAGSGVLLVLFLTAVALFEPRIRHLK
ncbi:MAG: MFS transporter [Proteobacteria bacterium]|nr:MFS transporter [Pseudomonadota bacterium]